MNVKTLHGDSVPVAEEDSMIDGRENNNDVIHLTEDSNWWKRRKQRMAVVQDK